MYENTVVLQNNTPPRKSTHPWLLTLLGQSLLKLALNLEQVFCCVLMEFEKYSF